MFPWSTKNTFRKRKKIKTVQNMSVAMSLKMRQKESLIAWCELSETADSVFRLHSHCLLPQLYHMVRHKTKKKKKRTHIWESLFKTTFYKEVCKDIFPIDANLIISVWMKTLLKSICSLNARFKFWALIDDILFKTWLFPTELNEKFPIDLKWKITGFLIWWPLWNIRLKTQNSIKSLHWECCFLP